MTDGEFPFRSFTMRSEGYDRAEVDSYADELRGEIAELRRALDTATPRGDGDTRLHDPEGAVTRTLAIAQETADRVLHDAQVEADRRRSEADEHSITVIADADERAARLLADMEAQAAEVREQGVAAARSAIQVERDKAMAELAHVRRVRDDLRTEAVDLKAALDRYRSQAREASDTLAAAASGPLMSLDLPAFIDDDVVLAGITPDGPNGSDDDMPIEVDDLVADSEGGVEADMAEVQSDEIMWESDDLAETNADEVSYLRAVDDIAGDSDLGDGDPADSDPADSDPADSDPADDDLGDGDPADDDITAMAAVDGDAGQDLADVIDIDAEASDDGDGLGGTFLAEIRAAAEDGDVALPPEGDTSDRFLSELRGIADDPDDVLDSDAADTFFDDDPR